ncbi:hypothetical protein GH714_035665 [Hevea brasiliensis]|uniref:Uncharacterized protein n=1 Tax=Hevea brasiliensis TaxID=3981 RepID=A0A6A6KS67_HEVBR|nr:hypothetical protein GH714_035665 [Hevea brasiliensis]
MEFNFSSGIISSSMADYKPWNKVSAYSFTLADLSLVSTTPTTMNIPESFFQEQLKIGDYHYPILDKDNQQEQKSTPCFSNNKVDEMGELGSDQEKLQIGVNKYHDYYYYCTFDEHVAHLCESVPAHGEDGGQPLNLKVDENNGGMVDENNSGMVLSSKEDARSEFDYSLFLYMVVNSVIMNHVTIGDGCSIQGSVICSNVHLQERVGLKDCQVGAGFVVTAGCEYKGESLARKEK